MFPGESGVVDEGLPKGEKKDVRNKSLRPGDEKLPLLLKRNIRNIGGKLEMKKRTPHPKEGKSYL